ncbi:MAG: hypothetical protein LC740_08460 [Actinobacteria bacterium]|nr:hypothetical protein [Actinomycetota bacterium]
MSILYSLLLAGDRLVTIQALEAALVLSALAAGEVLLVFTSRSKLHEKGDVP